MSGTSRDFLTHFPWTLTISLGMSLILAMIFIPFVQYLIIKPSKIQELADNKKQGFDILRWTQQGYERVLSWVFAHPWLSLGGAAMSVLLSILGIGTLEVRMMPKAERDQFAIEVYMPTGSTLKRTSSIVDSVYHILDKDERILSMSTFVGMSSPCFQFSYAPRPAKENYAQFIVRTRDNQATLEVLAEYSDKLAERYPEAYIRFKQLDYSNAQRPIELRLQGKDIQALKTYADSVMTFMRANREFIGVRTDFEEPLSAVSVQLDPSLASQMGITRTTLTSNLSAAYGDMSVGTLWEGNYLINIALKSKPEGVKPFDEILRRQSTPKYLVTSHLSISSVKT